MVSSKELERRITEQFKPSHFEVRDVSDGCGQAYEIVVVSESFVGKSRLARHRAVNNALQNEIAQLHAFTQKNFTPEEWGAQEL